MIDNHRAFRSKHGVLEWRSQEMHQNAMMQSSEYTHDIDDIMVVCHPWLRLIQPDGQDFGMTSFPMSARSMAHLNPVPWSTEKPVPGATC